MSVRAWWCEVGITRIIRNKKKRQADGKEEVRGREERASLGYAVSDAANLSTETHLTKTERERETRRTMEHTQ